MRDGSSGAVSLSRQLAKVGDVGDVVGEREPGDRLANAVESSGLCVCLLPLPLCARVCAEARVGEKRGGGAGPPLLPFSPPVLERLREWVAVEEKKVDGAG